ncbi:MAG: glycosyltransferase family 4 protein [Anaerolineae bacterium]|nr:glycosyltransferase family 4 protein [Anaerolineae bacterium]
MRVLFLSRWWPYPASNGSKIRIYNLLRQLARQHEVSLLSFYEDGEATPEQITHLQTFCQRVEALPRVEAAPGKLDAISGYLSRWPRSLVHSYSQEMAARVRVLAPETDVIIGSQVDTLRYFELAPQIPAILEEVEVTGYHEKVVDATSQTKRLRAQLTLSKLEGALRHLAEKNVRFTVVSDEERAYMSELTSLPVTVIPNGVDTSGKRPGDETPDPHTLIYTGAVTYSANYDAVSYFIREVWPLVRQRYPQARFTVTGGTGSVDVSDLAAQPGVTFTGFVPAVEPVARQHWGMVVPLREGGGTRLKVLEAMALGLPVISTSKGAEGLAINPGENILIADSPQQMVDAVSRLFENPDLRQQMAAAGRSLVEAQYDWSVIGQALLDLVEEVRVLYGQQSPVSIQ